MKKILSFIVLVTAFMVNTVKAQSNDDAIAIQLVKKNAAAIGLSGD